MVAPRAADMRRPAPPAQQRFGFANLDLPAGFVSYAGARSSRCSSGEAQQEMPSGTLQLQRRSGLARLGLSVTTARNDDRVSNTNSSSRSSMSPPKVPIQRCDQPRTQMLRSDSLTWTAV